MHRSRAYRRHQFRVHFQRRVRQVLWHDRRDIFDGDFVMRRHLIRDPWPGYFSRLVGIVVEYRCVAHRMLFLRRCGEDEPEYNLRPYKRHGRRTDMKRPYDEGLFDFNASGVV